MHKNLYNTLKQGTNEKKVFSKSNPVLCKIVFIKLELSERIGLARRWKPRSLSKGVVGWFYQYTPHPHKHSNVKENIEPGRLWCGRADPSVVPINPDIQYPVSSLPQSLVSSRALLTWMISFSLAQTDSGCSSPELWTEAGGMRAVGGDGRVLEVVDTVLW